MLDVHIEKVDIRQQSSDSENDDDEERAREEDAASDAYERKERPKDDRFLYPSIRLIETMGLISEIDIVQRQVFEDDIAFVAFDGIGLDLDIPSSHQAYVREYADDADEQQEEQDKDADRIDNA